MERTPPGLLRALLWKRAAAGGWPLEKSGLGFWELLFLARLEESSHEPRE